MRRRVVCGLSETIATFPPQRAFTSVDFPTFGRPATAANPDFTWEATDTAAKPLIAEYVTGNYFTGRLEDVRLRRAARRYQERVRVIDSLDVPEAFKQAAREEALNRLGQWIERYLDRP